jgi:hypothetical protein
MEKIFPLNLTARAATMVTGNPVTTRLEGGVGNCFPGLEFDHRNLDRRFFPGLVFEFGDNTGGALVQVDTGDPDLDASTFEGLPADAPPPAVQSALRAALVGADGTALGQGSWVLDSITQGQRTISVTGQEALMMWRLVRSLEPGLVTIVLRQTPPASSPSGPGGAGGSAPSGTPAAPATPPSGGSGTSGASPTAATSPNVTLNGWRRRFLSTRTGVISEAYQAGELTQSLCSPWMHDFRDCACTYWASNHPDIVLAEQVPGAAPDPFWEETPINWLRADRALERTTAAVGTEDGNRPTEMDHYEINQRWQDLAIVLRGHEVSHVFAPSETETANPLGTPDDLAGELVKLCQLEHALALEYLYAMYSVKDPAKAAGQDLKDAVTFVRHEILVIAVSEMRHLRWANQLIWELEHAGLTTKKFGPSLARALKVPGTNGDRLSKLRTLTQDVLNDFIAVEKPSGTLDGKYARVLATLREPKYPADLEQLAERILADGMQHFTRFREIQRVLGPFAAGKSPAYLQDIVKATAAEGKAATDLYRTILSDLESAYESGDMEDAERIAHARTTMFKLKDAADALANAGKGVPYF